MMEIREVMSGDETPVYELLCELENKELNKALFLKGFAMQRKDRSMKAWVLTMMKKLLVMYLCGYSIIYIIVPTSL